MKKNIIFIIASVLLIISSGCEDLNNTGEIKTKNSILYRLRVNASSQKLLIYRIAGMSELRADSSADMYYNFFNRNAEITLKDLQSGESTGFMLSQDTLDSRYDLSYYKNPYLPFYTNKKPFNAKPGTDYLLSVSTGVDVITGRLTTPGDFEITSPRSAEEIRGARNLINYNITWNKSKNAAGYFVSVTCPMRLFYPDSTWKVQYINDGSDIIGSTSCRLGDIFKYYSDAIQSGSIVIRVESYDFNYVQHYRNLKESVGLNNAYGCFSSSVMKEVRIYYDK